VQRLRPPPCCDSQAGRGAFRTGVRAWSYSLRMKRLYKYIDSIAHVPNLLAGSCKFTPVAELNDPSELVPNILVDEIEKSKERLRRDGHTDADMQHLRRQGRLFQRLAPECQAIPVPKTPKDADRQIREPIYDDVKLLARRLDDFARKVSSRVGLFCLSERYDSLPMWAHYASKASGLVVEYADLDSHFVGDDTGVLNACIPITYERENLGVTFDPQSYWSLLFAKDEDWRYEREHRVVLPTAECTSVVKDGKLLYLHDVPKQSVRRLILGWRMDSNSASRVRAQARELNSGTEVVQSKIVRGRVTLPD